MAYIESVVSSPQFREDDFAEFLETLTFYVISRIRHYKEENDGGDDIPQWLKNTLAGMHDKAMFGERALANMVALSGKTQEYLTRAMRRYYHKTPMQVINEIRINFAKTQLEVTNSSVSDIAFDSGYGDVSLFIKNFKRLTDVTPGNYRKSATALFRAAPDQYQRRYADELQAAGRLIIRFYLSEGNAASVGRASLPKIHLAGATMEKLLIVNADDFGLSKGKTTASSRRISMAWFLLPRQW